MSEETADPVIIEPVSKGRLKIKPADPVEVLRRRITDAHADALNSMVDSVKHAASCGNLLIEARNVITDPFRKWVAETLPFTYRTAYRYCKIAEAVADGAVCLDGVTSINEALKLLAAATREKEDDDSTEEKEEKDARIETFVTSAMKIETWFKKETSKAPLSTWSSDRKEVVKSQLEGVAAIYAAL